MQISSTIFALMKDAGLKVLLYNQEIAVINNFSKVFEITFNESLIKHLLSDGFIKWRSTMNNLFCITDYIPKSIDNDAQIDVI